MIRLDARRSIPASAAMLALCVLAVAAAVSPAHAGELYEPGAAGFSPRVPLSAFASPVTWFDPSRLHLSSTVSVGSGFGGTTSALQVTSLAYQFKAPFSMSVSVGNTFGFDGARSGGSPFFLEGLDLAWRPSKHALFRVEMHDVRSPLQYGSWGRGYPYSPASSFPY
jgi:hypothetical protein